MDVNDNQIKCSDNSKGLILEGAAKCAYYDIGQTLDSVKEYLWVPKTIVAGTASTAL